MTVDHDPRAEYQRRLQERMRDVAYYERRDRQVAAIRLGIALSIVVAAYFAIFRDAFAAAWLLVPVALFIALVAFHEKVAQALRRASRAVIFYEDGLARIDDRWIGRCVAPDVFHDNNHLYAADLDIFGQASLFELLCTARLRAGQDTLAAWLAGPAALEEIRSRQDAVEELRHRVDLREDLAILASDLQSSIHPDILVRWGNADPLLGNAAIRWLMLLFSAGTLLVLLAAPSAWPLAFAAEGALGLIYRRRVRGVTEGADRPETELALLAQLLGRLEREKFRSAKLAELRRSIDTEGMPPSQQIHRFSRLKNGLNWRRNQLFAPFSLIFFWASQFAFAIEKWRAHCGRRIGPWMQAVGEVEALCALAGFAYEHPDDPFPEIVAAGPVFKGEDLKHPLVPAAVHVPNSVSLNPGMQLYVVSGSNMSGKSTLLRTVGINAVLALAGAPVRARSLAISPLGIGATLRIQDSLQEGASRFYAEIQRIHHIMELTKKDLPGLFLLDEILHGTNSHDRAVGAEAIVRGLIGRRAIGLVTTHDLALAKVADALAPLATNVHFEDEMVGGKMVFDYKMRPGVVAKSNALALMRAVGLEV